MRTNFKSFDDIYINQKIILEFVRRNFGADPVFIDLKTLLACKGPMGYQ